MEKSRGNSFKGQLQLLLRSNKDFSQKLKQRLVFESTNLTNHFDFIVRLFNEGVLCDGSNDSEGSVGLKEMMAQMALMVACSKGADAIRGMMSALEGSGNSKLISGLRSWVNEDFAIETASDLDQQRSEQDSTLPIGTTEKLPKQRRHQSELRSKGTKLIDRIIACMEDDLMERLESYLVGKASEIVNVADFVATLVNQEVQVLDKTYTQLKTEPKLPGGQLFKNAVKAACSKKAIGSLVLALQSSNNDRILAETYEWLETSPVRKKNYPIAVKTLANQRRKEESKAVGSSFFEQAALSDRLSKVAEFKCQSKSASIGVSLVQFDKERMLACSTEGKLQQWDWRGEETANVALKVKDVTHFQYDEEILVLGTVEGTVHLFDARTFEEKSSISLFGELVIWLKFVESTLLIITKIDDSYKTCWVEIFRPQMRLLNQRSTFTDSWINFDNDKPVVCMCPDVSFLYYNEYVWVYHTMLGTLMRKDQIFPCCLLPRAKIMTLHVGNLNCRKRVVVAGCNDGTISMWSTSQFCCNQSPFKTFQGHSKAILRLCFLNGHLLSLDKSGKLLMWSGHDLENDLSDSPVARVLSRNFTNVIGLVAHERWLASYTLQDDKIKIWTLPDLWLRTG